MEDLKEDLNRATTSGNIECIKTVLQSLVEDFKDLTQQEKHGFLGQRLYDVVLSSKCTTDVIKLLLDAGADVNWTDQMHQSVLLQSLYNCSFECINFLVDNGADTNHQNVNGQTDFLHLFSNGKFPNLLLSQLINYVSNIFEKDLRTGGTFLHLVSECQNEQRVLLMKRLLENGISINSTDNNGDTPLHIMTGVADIECVEYLINNGADVFTKNRLGETAFHYLASNTNLKGLRKLTDLFMKKGLDINEKDNAGKTVMHHAMMSKDTTIEDVLELLNLNVKVNVKDTRGRNEIYCAVDEVDFSFSQKYLDQRAEIIKCLVKAGVNVNERNEEGISPLHLATLKNDLEILVALLDCGADVLQKTKTGAMPLHWACKNYNMLHVIIHYFLKGGHDLDEVDIFGSTALHWAVWFKEKPATQTLLQVGCDYTIKDNLGSTPGSLAKKLNFDYYSSIVDGERFREMEFLSLQEPYLECSGEDPLFACPHLKFIKKQNGNLQTKKYIDHLNLHKPSMKSLLEISLGLTEMGLFYPLEDNHLVPETFLHIFSLLAKRLSLKYPLFACEVSLAGSVNEGTKVNIPNEFDYLFTLSNMSRFFSPVENDEYPKGYVKVKVKSDAEDSPYQKYINVDGYLDIQVILQDFYKYVNEELAAILADCEEFRHIMLLQSLKEIWCTLSELKFFVFGQQAKQFEVSVDIVPVLQFEDWVPKNLRKFDSDICDLCEYDSLSCFPVIMKTPNRSHVKDFTLFFRISHAYLEQSIIKNIHFPVKKGYILLKILLESGYLPKVVDHDNKRTVKTYITSYHLKTCFLHEWYERALEQERSSSQDKASNSTMFVRNIVEFEPLACEEDDRQDVTETWGKHNSTLSTDWAKRILHRYKTSIERKSLPSFFNPDKNLFGIDSINEGIQEQETFFELVRLLEHILDVAIGKESDSEIVYSREGHAS